MKQPMNCPICGNQHTRTYYEEEYWGHYVLTENYFNCPDCGYWSAMAYSDTMEGIRFPHTFRQAKLLVKNWKKAKPCLDGKFGFRDCMI